ncbi:MAG: O-acetyl-ADP-ribose deacetylase [Nevskiaceae bacterium]|nr:MAG: O-acetyl-ADP-ribose deacetylase [Nevskiaceae bacterium]TBR74748.1 MAG: O-acetyl-ADP-ribose deacetylase [Nevskiaceae bacterium]
MSNSVAGLAGRLELVSGDITRLQIDAIVNAANAQLAGGGGVDGAIHAAAGPAVLEECRRIVAAQGICPAGNAVITGAGRLPARHIIHAVGPIWHGGGVHEAEQLAGAYRSSLQLATEHGVKSIAFPNISTGVYHYPKQAAANIAIATVCDYLLTHAVPGHVVFCCHDAENIALYRERLAALGT